MKNTEKIEAIRLRKEEGLSLRKIAEKLQVSKGSVSLWVRNIELTEDQKIKLHRLELINWSHIDKAIKINIEKHKSKREEYQKKGQKKLEELSGFEKELYIAGCMLYWAEGFKKNNKNSVSFSNSDLNMLLLFISFLKIIFKVQNSEISLCIHCYNDMQNVAEIEDYWIKNLKLDKTCLRKTMINKVSSYSQNKKCGMLRWGTVRVTISNTEILQQIYGAIQKFANFENNEWLTGIVK